MPSARRFAAFLLFAMLPGCAAIADWNAYVGPPPSDAQRIKGKEHGAAKDESDDAHETPPEDTSSPAPPAESDAGARPPPVVLQTGAAGDDEDLSSVTASLARPTTAGSTILVAIGWYSVTVDIETLSDSFGSSYEVAVATKLAGANETITQRILFARNVPAGTYAIAVRFPQAVDTPDVRVAEVQGLDPNAPFVTGAEVKGRLQALTAGPFHLLGPGLVFAAATIEDELHRCDGFETCIISPANNMAEAKVIASGDVTVANVLARAGDSVLQAAVFH